VEDRCPRHHLLNNTFSVRDGLSTPILYSRSGTSISGALSFQNNAVFNYGSGNYFTTTGSSTFPTTSSTATTRPANPRTRPR
jgi:hypothetical protein